MATRAQISECTARSIKRGLPVKKEKAEAICNLFNINLKDGFTEQTKLQNLSANTIGHHHRLISSILSIAVQWQVLLSNPAQRVKPPKFNKKEARFLDDVQAAELVNKLDNEPLKYKTMIIVLIYSGMRRSELCGLEWRDVDFDNNVLHIERNSLYMTGKGTFTDTTKTASSVRAMKLPEIVFKLLREYKAYQNAERLKLGDQWVESNRLFTQWNGKPIHPDTVSGWFKSFVQRNEFPDVSLHSLRHTNATLLIASGTNIRTVSSRLGHAQTSTTSNIYAHAIRSADAAASDVLDNILSKGSSTNGK